MTFRERRACPRCVCSQRDGRGAARIRPGHDVQVLNLSSAGALIQSTTRLAPNSRVELRLAGSRSSPIRGRIVRSYVSAVDADVIFYRSAIAFEQVFDLSAIDPEDG
ncbi:MAG TPA: hypothetical protein VH702_13705 [Vicinamibacterales bacterium]|jgi:hypothetical protein